MNIPAFIINEVKWLIEEAGEVVRAYNSDSEFIQRNIARLQKTLHYLRKSDLFGPVDLGVKWFVTTKGYKPIYIIGGKRKGEYAGRFLMDRRCVGYFDTEAEAVRCVEENWGDIVECGSYPYAIIESFGPGLYPHHGVGRERFFWWYAGKYMEIARPHWGKRTCNWGIG